MTVAVSYFGRNGPVLLDRHTLARRLLPLFTLLCLTGVTACQSEQNVAESAPPGVYVALGASDSVGVGADNPPTENWPAVVHAGLPAGTRFINLGISGATLRDVLQQEVPVARDADAQWISLWSGVNDLRAGITLPTFTAQLDEVLAQLRPAGSAADAGPVIVVLNLPDLRQLPVFRMSDATLLDATVRQWNAAIAETAGRHGALVVDLYAHGPELVSRPDYISSDGFHPSTAGYRRIGDLVLTVLNEHVSAPVQ